MRRGTLILVAACCWHAVSAASLLRLGRGAVAARSMARRAGRASWNTTRHCTHARKDAHRSFSMLQATPAALGAMGTIVADGYSRVGCDVDLTPEAQRVHFKDAACGPELTSCRLLEKGMEPRLCFDFCRQFEHAKFFAIVGIDCYCTTYFHAKTMGGEGECNFACEGDPKEICGGREKSSWFEMHMCQDSVSEADAAIAKGEETVKTCIAEEEAGGNLTQKLRVLGKSWDLSGACSIPKYGALACGVTEGWLSAAAEVESQEHATTLLSMTLDSMLTDLRSLKGTMAQSQAVTADTAKSVELATASVQAATAKAAGSAAGLKTTIAGVNGPVVGKQLDKWEEVFTPFANQTKGWHAFCLLTPIPGASFAAVSSDSAAKAACANQCLLLSSGTGACAAFNYASKDGLATCQLLTANGLVEPADSLGKAVPILEVSNTKASADMGLSSLGCYGHGAFRAGSATGPLGTEVIRQIVKANL
mmetsp:Transcript_114886/g.199039  ORF Transcript_114886/g.199039 Transcript_114886/m.199039 type:complete len:478 (-) Transcript_114886:96-1529(-)